MSFRPQLISSELSIEALQPRKIIPGHIESGWQIDAQADLMHCRKYLDLFSEKITNALKKPTVEDIFSTFKNAFPRELTFIILWNAVG